MPHGIAIRQARPGEEQAIHVVLDAAYAGSQEEVAPFAEWRVAMIGDSEFAWECWFVAEVDGRLAGVCLCWTSAFVKDLAVQPALRRRGVGEALLRHALGEFASRGATCVSLKVRRDNPTGAERLYRRLGFVEDA